MKNCNFTQKILLMQQLLDLQSFKIYLVRKYLNYFYENTGFDTTQKSFLEILSELEKLDIIKREEWLKLREIRNKISHEYPDEIDEIIDNLNKMIKSINTFEKIYNKIKAKYEAIK